MTFFDKQVSVNLAIKYLEKECHGGLFNSYVSSGRDKQSDRLAPSEIFSSVVIADILSKVNNCESLVDIILSRLEKEINKDGGLLTFFEDRNSLPPDADTNSLVYSLLLENRRIDEKLAKTILEIISDYVDNEGKVQVWLSRERENRSDRCVAANVLYLSYILGKSDKFKKTENWIVEELSSGAYLDGSRYYHSPEVFLYFLGKLMKFPHIGKRIRVLMNRSLNQRIGKTKYPLDLCMRIRLSNILGVEKDEEMSQLMNLQQSDGSWPIDSLYREGKNKIYYISKSLPTAFAVEAILNK